MECYSLIKRNELLIWQHESISNFPGWKEPFPKEHMLMIPFTQILIKYKLIYIDRKQISSCSRKGRVERGRRERLTWGKRKFGGIIVCSPFWLRGWFHMRVCVCVCVRMPTFDKSYALKIHSIFYVIFLQ